MISIIGVQNATAHQSAVLLGNDHTNNMVLAIGHVDEPTFGSKPGIHEGKHWLELYIRDEATRLMIPQGNTELMFDKYYFEDVAAYNAAESIDDATQIQLEIPINQAYGKPGYYVHRQIIQDGIYGYHVYGTIDYYGVGHRDIDVTFFCGRVTSMGNPSKFENVVNGTTRGEFGCPQSIQNINFPKKDHYTNHTSDHDKMDHSHDATKMSSMPIKSDATGTLSDGTNVLVQVSQPIIGERSKINIMFKDAQHINYDIIVKQGSLTVLEEIGVHDHNGMYEHKTMPLTTTSPFDIVITFQGYGMKENKTPPFNEPIRFASRPDNRQKLVPNNFSLFIIFHNLQVYCQK